jgi:hypothetical protein
MLLLLKLLLNREEEKEVLHNAQSRRRSSYTVHNRAEEVLQGAQATQQLHRARSRRRRRSSYTVHNRARRSSYTVHTRKKKQLHRAHARKEEAVTPCTRDYVATNGWLSKGRNRLTSGHTREEEEVLHAKKKKNFKNPLKPCGSCAHAKKKKKCYTALTRLRRNEPLARERVQQGRTRGCHQPHFKKLERDERAEANNCPSATEVTW